VGKEAIYARHARATNGGPGDAGVSPMIRALVTGAASGLGEAVTDGLLARGCSVAMVDLVPAPAREHAHAIIQDLTAPGGAEAAVTHAIAALSGLDVVVNNAGYGVGEAFLEMREATWDRTLDLNLKAVALICAAAGRHMREQRSGRIVNVTSPASRMALPNYLAYAASKAGVDAVTRAAAVALAPYGITVNSVAPGMMDTPMQRVTERQLAAIEGREDIDTFLDERTRRIPLGRRVDTSVVAGAVVWLALDAPDYITAERMNVSGGLDKD
jgi:3-oxoacyl-[acyl-carrier protein] reductase